MLFSSVRNYFVDLNNLSKKKITKEFLPTNVPRWSISISKGWLSFISIIFYIFLYLLSFISVIIFFSKNLKHQVLWSFRLVSVKDTTVNFKKKNEKVSKWKNSKWVQKVEEQNSYSEKESFWRKRNEVIFEKVPFWRFIYSENLRQNFQSSEFKIFLYLSLLMQNKVKLKVKEMRLNEPTVNRWTARRLVIGWDLIEKQRWRINQLRRKI